jgi:TetR/AcrR family fatty acid metabolism transcriptional regulator
MEQSKKECILAAAARAFAKWGFKKAAVDEIAKDAGVAKGTVYLAADTKEDLFYQAVHREVRAWVAETAKVIDPRVPADQLLLMVSQRGFEYLESRPLVRDLLFGNHQLLLPEWADRLDDLRDLGRHNLVEILRLGVRQGLFRDNIDVEEVANVIQDVALTTHVFMWRKADRLQRMARRQAAAIDLLLHGLRAPGAATTVTAKDEKKKNQKELTA